MFDGPIDIDCVGLGLRLMEFSFFAAGNARPLYSVRTFAWWACVQAFVSHHWLTTEQKYQRATVEHVFVGQ